MSFRNYYNRVINENSDERLIGQGKYFKTFEIVDEEGVIKRPVQGNKISSIEIKKHQFMKDNEASGVFVRILQIKPDTIRAEKANTKTGNAICWIFTEDYLDITGNEEGIEDDDMKSDFIMNEVLSPKSSIDWEWVERTAKDIDPNDNYVKACNYLVDYHKRLKRVKGWPVSTFDIHAENVGVVNRGGSKKLVIIDF
jgi:hypothetical protein